MESGKPVTRETNMESAQDEQTLLTRIKVFPIPPKELDLLEATPAELREYGLPPRPSPESEPDLFAVWEEFFVPRPIFVETKVALVLDEFRPQIRETVAAAAAVSPTTRYETSRNWSGAYIEPNHAKVFVQLSGRWKVPTPAVPAGAEPPPQGSVVYACSTWIGLDGQRRYIDSSLPQVGTWQAVALASDGTEASPETYAWFQWWARNYAGNAPGKITSVPVNPGDEVACMVRVWLPSVAVIYFKNLTTNVFSVPFLVSAPIVTLRGGHQHQFTISGATAEWVIERPTRLDNGELYDLADYDHAEIRHCHAAEADPTMPNWPWVVGTNEILKGARFIRMYDFLNDPRRTTFTSMPRREDDTAVCVKYGGFSG
jgi:hypothetical protein